MKQNLPKTSYYPFLDGFRCYAMVWVLVHHLNSAFDLRNLIPCAIFPTLDRFAQIGLIGVDIFLVISGFLISGLLFDHFQKPPDIKRFYIRRSFKIIPQYLVVVVFGIICTVVVPLTSQQLLLKSTSYFLLFQNYIEPLRILSHLWSIAVEEHFYFIYPLMLYAICRIGKTALERRKILLWVIVVLVILVFIIRRYTFIKYPYNPLLLFQMTHLRFDALLIGCLIKLYEPSLTKWPVLWKKWGGLLCSAASVVCFIVLFKHFDPCRSSGYVFAYSLGGLLLLAAILGFRPLLFLAEVTLLRRIGRSSYAIYLWHYPVIVLAKNWFPAVTWPQLVLLIACILGLGILSTLTIERYFLNIRQKVSP